MSATQNAVANVPAAPGASAPRRGFGNPLGWALAGLLAVLAFAALAVAALAATVLGVLGALAAILWRLVPGRRAAGPSAPEGWVMEVAARR